MADVKISGLPASTVPLAGTEVLPIVQGGTTKQVSVNNLTAGKTVLAAAFDTDIAAAAVTLSGTTLAADGTDTNINLAITPKGSGGLGINGSPTGDLAGSTLTAKFCVKQDESGPVAGFVKANNSAATPGATVYGCRSRGTLAAPTIVQNGDVLATYLGLGFDGTDLAIAADIEFQVDGTPGSNDMPGRILFKTTPDGTQTPVEALRINSAQVATFAQPIVGSISSLKSNATTGILQVAGPGAGTTRVMTTPDANFTAARTDAAQTFTGDQTFGTVLATTFDTNVAAAGVTLAGTTLAADGTDANINISLVPKGTGQVVVNAGTAALPAVAPTGDPNTGILFPAADTIAFAEGGAEAMRIDSTGRAIIGASSSTLTFSSAQSRFQVAGADFQTASASVICNAASDQTFGLYLAQTGATILSNFTLGIVNFGAGTNSSARISSTADGNHGAGSTPGNLRFFTTPSGASNVTERMRLTSDGYLRMASGSLGIQFNGDTAAANALDDYEEGTWTPGVSGDGGSAGSVAFTSAGYYTKIGRTVTLNGSVSFTNLGSWTGRVRITDIPFAANVVGCYGSAFITFATVANAFSVASATGTVSSTAITFPWSSDNGGGGDNIRFTDLAANSFIGFTLTYIV
jgi:hypothetical protein